MKERRTNPKNCSRIIIVKRLGLNLGKIKDNLELVTGDNERV